MKYLILIIPVMLIAYMAFLWSSAPEMPTHPSGNAVYIPGEACVMNATPDINEQEFLDLMFFCSIQHMEYLSNNPPPT